MRLPLPLSSNHAYSRNKQGRRFLSAPFVRFKEEVRTAVRAALLRNLEKTTWLTRNTELTLIIELVFDREDVYSRTWPKTADYRHKRVDASNRVKMLEDALMESLKIDDSQIFNLHILKSVTAEGETPHSKVVISAA